MKKQKTKKGRRAAEKEQPQVAAAAGSPEAEPSLTTSKIAAKREKRS